MYIDNLCKENANTNDRCENSGSNLKNNNKNKLKIMDNSMHRSETRNNLKI